MRGTTTYSSSPYSSKLYGNEFAALTKAKTIKQNAKAAFFILRRSACFLQVWLISELIAVTVLWLYIVEVIVAVLYTVPRLKTCEINVLMTAADDGGHFNAFLCVREAVWEFWGWGSTRY